MFGGSLDSSQFRSISSSLSVLIRLKRQTHKIAGHKNILTLHSLNTVMTTGKIPYTRFNQQLFFKLILSVQLRQHWFPNEIINCDSMNST